MITPDYLAELADIADPEKLWRLTPFEQMDLTTDKRRQLDTGIALRRYAALLRETADLAKDNKSLLLTHLTPNSHSHRWVKTPVDILRLRYG